MSLAVADDVLECESFNDDMGYNIGANYGFDEGGESAATNERPCARLWCLPDILQRILLHLGCPS